MAGDVPTRQLAWSQVPVSRLGLGLARIGSIEAPIGPREAIKLIEGALDLGINIFDTADVYGQGDSERLLGAALKGNKREQAVICTKAGLLVSPKARIASFAKPVLRPILRALRNRRGTGQSVVTRPSAAGDVTPAHIARSIDASLRRLKSDYIDLFLLHNPPTEGLDREGLARVFEDARAAGKIRAVGVSARDASEFDTWASWSKIDAVQLRPDRNAFGHAARNLTIFARQVFAGEGDVLSRVRAALSTSDVIFVGTTSQSHLRENLAIVQRALSSA